MDGRIRQHAAAGDAIRAIRANHHLRAKFTLVGDNGDTLVIRLYILYRHPFPDFDSRFPGFLRQPGIELIPADDAQGVTLRCRNGQPFARKIQMRGGGVHVRDFAHVQAQAFEDDFSVRYQAPGAQLGARIMRFFQEQDAGSQMRGDLHQMQGSGESGRSAADDQDIVLLNFVLHLEIVLLVGLVVKSANLI